MVDNLPAGSLYADVYPDFSRFGARSRRPLQREGNKLGQEIGTAASRPIAAGVARAIREGLNQAGRRIAVDAARHARAYSRAFRAALRQQPIRVPVELDTSKIDRALAGVARRARRAGGDAGEQFGDGFDRTTRERTRTTPVGPDRTRSRRQGEDTGGAFADGFRKRLTAALRALPPVSIGVARNAAEQQIKDLTAQLRDLSTKRVGVDIDAREAIAEVQRIDGELRRLAASTPDVQVRADTAAALAQLEAVWAAARRLDGDTVNVRVDADTSGARAQLAAVGDAGRRSSGGVQALIAVIAGLAPVAVPAAAAAAAALAAIGPAAAVGAAGIGVAALGLFGVGDAVKALGEAEQDAGKAAAQSAVRQASLASAAERVRDAQRGVADAHREAQFAAERAARRVADAQRALTDAEQDALRAREALTDAYRRAREELEDLDTRVRSNALAQRQAAVDIADAEKALADARAELADAELSGRAGPERLQALRREVDAAQIRVERELLGQQTLRREGERLASQQADAARKGVEGSEQVRAARERIADTDRSVADAQQALADARQAQDRQAAESARQIAAAQRQVVSAQRALQTATVQAGAAGTAAMDKLRETMGALSPAGRRFASFLHGLRPVLDRLRATAQAGLLPGLEAGMRALLPVLPQINLFIGRVASALGEFAAAAGQALASPFWVDFFDQIGQLAGPVFREFGRILDGLARGFASLILAFAPLSLDITRGIADLAESFARWAAGLDGSDAFSEFMEYVRRNGPRLLTLFARFALLLLKLGIALAPLGEIVLVGLVEALTWLSSLDPAVIAYIAGAVTLLVGAAVALAAGPVAAIGAFVAAVVLLVAAVVSAYQRFETFRTVVQAVFSAVAGTAMWLWEHAFKPALEGIGALVLWLWRNVIQPAWTGIQLAITVAWTIIQIVFGLIQIGIKILAEVFRRFYNATIKPIWENGIRPVFQALGDFVSKHVVPPFRKGVEAIAKAWDGLKEAAMKPVRFLIETVLNKGIIAAYNKLARAFGVDTVSGIALPGGTSGVGRTRPGVQEFARGGYVVGPGTATSDSIPARLSNGEYVIPAHIVRRLGVRFFDLLIGRRNVDTRRPGDGSEGLAFASGGLVDFGRNVWDAVTSPVKLVSRPLTAALGKIPGAGTFSGLIAGMGRRLVDGLIGWIRGAASPGGAVGDVGRAQAFVRTQAGKPYLWAGVGPHGYDCSGVVGAALNVLKGKDPHRRVFTTHNMHKTFTKVGQYGPLTAGWAHAGERGGGSVGHTAAQVGGLPFESRGGVGVLVGSKAAPVTSFARFGTYDSGGWLLPGLTLVNNQSGRPEPVLNDQQWRAMLHHNSGPREQHTWVVRDTTLDPAFVARWQDKRDALARVGRP